MKNHKVVYFHSYLTLQHPRELGADFLYVNFPHLGFLTLSLYLTRDVQSFEVLGVQVELKIIITHKHLFNRTFKYTSTQVFETYITSSNQR